tara:strand:+ start:240 stop:857 length:618 start_codon:yes stop_codon:yes gene_type:complete
MYKKPIIVFEGIECSGKSHHVYKILSHFKKKKIKYIHLREPGGSKNSEKIRKLILDSNTNFEKKTDLLLYLAARNENIEKIIKKNYKKKIILIDRFIDSTIAYQHYGMGINLKFIKIINNFLLTNIKINFTFLNIVNNKNLKIRLKKRKKLNKYDKFNISFYNKAQKGFLNISKNSKNYQVVDSNKNINTNEKIILKRIYKLIKI